MSSALNNIIDKCYYNKGIYQSIYIEKENIKLNLEEVLNLIGVVSDCSIMKKTRNMKLANRKREHIESEMLKSLSNLKLIKNYAGSTYYNSEHIEISIGNINKSINEVFQEKSIKKTNLNNLELDRLRSKIENILKNINNLDLELNELSSYINDTIENINKKINRANRTYTFLKFAPYWIIILIGYVTNNKNTLIILGIWSIYSFLLGYMYKMIFYSIHKYDVD